jgi:arylformamidase
MPAMKSKYIDVTVNLSPDTPVWPGAPRYKFEQKKFQISGGGEATSTHFDMIAHCGTHIDAPLHVVRNGKTIERLDLETLIGPCRVIEHRGEGHITKEDLSLMGFIPTKRLLVKSRNSARLRNGTLDETFLSLLPDALEYLMQSGVELLGVDGLSIGPFGELTMKNHLMFCTAGGIVLETLDLSDVEPGEYGLIALPIKLQGSDGAPARGVLVRPENTESAQKF